MRDEEAIELGFRRNPRGFLTDILGFQPWSKQLEILESVRDNPRTAVRSANGVGKTSLAARAVLWFLAAHRRSVVITTAPTWKQVETLLWREMAVAFDRGKELYQMLGSAEIFKTDLTIAPDWYATGISTEKPERFSGFHSPHLLLLVDEASGVDDSIFQAAEGFLTGKNARVLLISNPTQLSGEFYRAFHRDASLWNRIHISIFDTPNFAPKQEKAFWEGRGAKNFKLSPETLASLPQPEYAELMKRKYGDESALYAIRVLGEFPKTQDNAVIPLGIVEQAQYRTLPSTEPVIISSDIARAGGDETVIVVRRGSRVRIRDAYRGKDLNWTVGRLLQIEREVYAETQSDVRHVIDFAGLGSGVYDQLREKSAFPVIGFNSAHRAFDPREFPNRRSEAWFQLADQLDCIDLDPDEQLLEDLVAPVFKVDSAGRRVVEAKDETRKRLGRSPDRADAVIMAYAFNPTEAQPMEDRPSQDLRALSAGVLTTKF